MIDGEVEVVEIDALPQQRGHRFAGRTGFDPRAPATPYRWFRRSQDEPDVLLEAGQIEPRDADGGREGGPAYQTETR
jgi:hypothetical protein